MTLRTKIYFAIGITVVMLAAVFYIQSRFTATLHAYSLAAAGHDTAAYVPGAATNTTRRVLNRLLGEILIGTHTREERLALAAEGLEALQVSEQEIDAIGDLGENVTDAIQKLESKTTLMHRAEKAEFLTLAQKRFDIAADVRGLSYLANHHIAGILTRIIEDGGELTAAHSASLNDQIPEVEADYDRRAALYRELETTALAMRGLADILGRGW